MKTAVCIIAGVLLSLLPATVVVSARERHTVKIVQDQKKSPGDYQPAQDERRVYIPATYRQQNYLPSHLATTRKIVIRLFPKFGKTTYAVITDRKEIARFVQATKVKYVKGRCACLGYLEIFFILKSGKNISFNYKSGDRTEHYIRYGNPWNVDAFPSPAFQQLVEKYISRYQKAHPPQPGVRRHAPGHRHNPSSSSTKADT